MPQNRKTGSRAEIVFLGADVVDIFPLSKFILPELTYYLACLIKIKGPMR